MTVHLISVGVSVLERLEKPGEKLGGDPALAAAIRSGKAHLLLAQAGIPDHQRDDRASDWLAGALAADADPGRSPADAARLAEVIGKVKPGRWPSRVSAEAETFDRTPEARYPLARDDIAILVCSDTPRGLLAGLWDALALTGGEISRVRYLPAPDSPLVEIRGNAVLVRVPGLDAGSRDGFRRAMGGLGLLARNLFASRQLRHAEDFRFYLSGGFKAAVPYLIGLAEAVRSVDVTRLRQLGVADLMPGGGPPYPVRAFVLHETAARGTSAIELPLRLLVADSVREELTGFGASGTRAGVRGYGLLSGYAYEVRGPAGRETCELTAFGEGLRALFGVGPEDFGR